MNRLYTGPNTNRLVSELGIRLDFVLLIAPVIIGLTINSGSSVATLYTLFVIAVVIFSALTAKNLETVLYAVAYLTASDVLFRMTGASFYWEGPKYFVALCVLLATFRFRQKLTIPAPIFVYALFLLPGVLSTLLNEPMSRWHHYISGSFSGQIQLIILVICFSNISVSLRSLAETMKYMMLPAISIASITLYGVVSSPDIVWRPDSNFSASGGYGPNQVSTALGAGVLASVLVISILKVGLQTRILVFVTAIILFSAGLLTFSRGGMIGLAISIFVFWGIQIPNRQNKLRYVSLAFIVLLLFSYVVIPYLDRLTGETLVLRYQASVADTDSRASLGEAEIEVFLENPLGVGVGRAISIRTQTLRTRAASHTEYTRILAEHGVLGLLAMGIFALMLLKNVFKQNTLVARALVASFIMWALFYMTHAALRTAMPAFLLGLTFIHFYSDAQAAGANNIDGSEQFQAENARYSK